MLDVSETVKDNYNAILIGTCTHPIQACCFEWPKYSTQWSTAWPLCNSWDSCETT